MLKILLSACAMALVTFVLAQGPPPSPPGVPIDGGLGILLAGGVAYGIKKVRDYRNSH